MQTRYLIVILALLYFGNITSQNDTLNRTDDFNCKYGYWKVYKDLIDEPQLVEEGLFVNGKKFGLWNEYYKDGTLRNQLNFLNGRPNGFMVLYFQNGDTSEFGYFRNNRWYGKYVSFFQGNRRQHIFFFNEKGKRDGCQLYYNESGELIREADYVDGKETYGREFYEDGAVKEDITGNITRQYDKDGCITKMIAYHPGNKKNYTETIYYKNGNISSILPFVDSKRNGMAYIYYENGNLKLEGAYKNDKLNGKRSYHDNSGKKINEEFIMYGKDGKFVERKGRCIHGKPEGEMKVYDSNGNVVMQINFKNGEPHGNAYYYSNNKLTSMEIYSNGTFVSEFSYKTFSSNQ